MPDFNAKELKVIDAAHALFHRYGFKRVTMNDIAVATEMSRPALYLVFPNKEEIFEATVRRHGAVSLKKIRAGVAQQKTVAEKLRLAFELWAVQPFEIVQQAPDARELIECTHGFARTAMSEIRAEFKAILTEILSEVAPKRSKLTNAAALAHLLVASTLGFKNTASDSEELRRLIATQIEVVLKAVAPLAP
jgi:AcrR family transcriptional regulator